MRGSASSQRPISTFCWLPPESAPTGAPSPAVRTVSWRDHAPAPAAAPARRRRMPAREMRRRIARVRLSRTLIAEQQALGLAVLRHQGDADAPAHRVARTADAHGLAVDARPRPPRLPLGAEQHEEQLAMAMPGEAADAQDLAPAQRAARRRAPAGRDSASTSSTGAGAGERRAAADRASPRRWPVIRVTASSSASSVEGADVAAVAEDGDAVGDAADLVPAVRGEDDAGAARRAAGGSAPNSHATSRSTSEEVGSSRNRMSGSSRWRGRSRRSAARPARCPRSAPAGRYASMPMPGQQRLGRRAPCRRRSISAERAARLARRAAGSRRPSSRAAASAPGTRSRRRARAPPAGRTGDLAALDADCPGIRAQPAAQHLDHRALAGAVLADQRMHLAGAAPKRRVIERAHAAERLEQPRLPSDDAGRLPGRSIDAGGSGQPAKLRSRL